MIFDAPLANLFQDTHLASILNRNPIVCIDVGSRDGFEQDLLPIAFGVDGIAFEPDPIAFEALRCQCAVPWRSMRYLNIALAGGAGERMLNVPIHPGSASLLEHDLSIGQRFNKTEFFEARSKTKVSTLALDDVLAAVGSISPAYIKLDIEGLEIEVLQGASRALSQTVALKIEVSFLPFRRGQPLAADVDLYVRQRGFELVDLLNPVYWRIFDPASQAQHGFSIPYSRGQLAHGDYLFFRAVETLDNDVKRFEAAVLAMNYGFFDHAAAIMRRPEMSRWLRKEGIANPVEVVAEVSAKFKRAVRAHKRHGPHALLQRWRRDLRIGPRLRRALGVEKPGDSQALEC